MANAIGQLTQMPRVPGVTPPAPKPEPGAVYTSEIEKLQPKIEEVRGKRATAETEASKLAAEKETFGAEQAVRKAEGVAQAGEQFQKTMAEAPMRPELEEKVKQEKDFFFQPSQRDGMTMATIASFLMVLGTSIGKGGKNNAMAALSGLNGMMEGYRKRSDELYKQEKQQFESNAKALKDQIGTLRQALQDYEKQASVDKQGALQKLDIALAKEGADFLKARVQRQGVVNLLPELIRQEKTLDAQINNYEKKRADAQEAARRDRERLETQRLIQQERLAAQQQMQEGRLQAKPQGKGGSALNDRYAFNINEAFSQAAIDLLNVSQMPANTTLGMFAGMTGQSGDTMLKSLSNTFARTITPEESRMMQQIVSGLDQNMARALGGGYATSSTKAIVNAYKEQVAQSGDSAAAQAMFLARMKQELGVLSKAFKNHPGANEGYVADMNEYMNELEKAIPFNVQQVLAANRGNQQTISQKFEGLSKQPSKVPLPQSGAPTVTPSAQAQPPQAPKEGDTAVSKSGKSMIFKNGQWEYQ